jgi:hypothetical protein
VPPPSEESTRNYQRGIYGRNIKYSTSLRSIYETIILPVVLYGWETWSQTLRKEHWLRAFEDRVLRRIFGPKRDEVTGEWRKVHNEELCNWTSSLSIIRMIKSRRMRLAGHVARVGERSNACRLLVGNLGQRYH